MGLSDACDTYYEFAQIGTDPCNSYTNCRDLCQSVQTHCTQTHAVAPVLTAAAVSCQVHESRGNCGQATTKLTEWSGRFSNRAPHCTVLAYCTASLLPGCRTTRQHDFMLCRVTPELTAGCNGSQVVLERKPHFGMSAACSGLGGAALPHLQYP